MKYRSIIIIVEGQTEEEFVNQTLRPWFLNQDVLDVRAIKIRTSKTTKGGNLNYAHFKNTVILLLKQEKDILISSFIDFFRLPNEFPGFRDLNNNSSAENRVEFLEQRLFEDIDSQRFIPHIQLHEFESLLFADIKGFKEVPEFNRKQIAAIEDIINDYPNPELINDHPNTAPSKRLEAIYPKYSKVKVLYGSYIAQQIGISILLERCPHFNKWLENLMNRMK